MKKISILFILSLVLFACSSDNAEKKVATKPDALVTVGKVEKKDMPINLYSFGTIAPSQTVNITARTGGQLTKIFVTQGQLVNEGDKLFEIDKEPYLMALAASKAQAEATKVQLNKLTSDTKRTDKLAGSGYVSQDSADQAKTSEAALRAQLKAAEVAIQKAELDISYCDITAPTSGRIGVVKVDVGNYVAPAQVVLTTLEQLQPAKLSFSVPEVYLSKIRSDFEKGNLPVQVITQNKEEESGLLSFIGSIDTTTGTVLLQAKFENKNNILWSGQFVEVVLTLEVLEGSLVVPARAVTYGPSGSYVYVIDENNIAHYTPVEVRVEENNEMVLTSGVKEGDSVVLEGHVRLTDKIKVRFN